MQFLHYGCLKISLFPRALLIISHHDKHKAKKCVLLGAHLANASINIQLIWMQQFTIFVFAITSPLPIGFPPVYKLMINFMIIGMWHCKRVTNSKGASMIYNRSTNAEVHVDSKPTNEQTKGQFQVIAWFHGLQYYVVQWILFSSRSTGMNMLHVCLNTPLKYPFIFDPVKILPEYTPFINSLAHSPESHYNKGFSRHQ